MSDDPGPGVDATGNPVIDPTRNVVAILDAAVKRLDDLREADVQHNRQMADLRFHYEELLRTKETERIDAIRAVDVGAVNRAAEVSATQATTLAVQVATSAETLRTQVAATAVAATTALAAALEPLQKDIADLRRAQYEQQGVRSQVAESSTSGRGNAGIAIAVVSVIVAAVAVIATIVIAMIASGSTP